MSRFTLLLALVVTLHAAEPAADLGALTFSGDQSALDALDREIGAAGADAAKLAALESRLLAVLQRKDSSFAARQAVAQRLGSLLAQGSAPAKPATYRVLGNLLADERDSDVARLALEPAAGAAIDTLFLNAVAKTSGRPRLGLIDSLGRRRTPAAVPPLAALLRDNDAATAAAAARALGQIGGEAALNALAGGPASPAVAKAQLAAASSLPAPAAAVALRKLAGDAALPASVRAAAFRASLDADPADTATRLGAAFTGSDAALKAAALEAVATSKAPGLVAALAANLAGYDPVTQAAVIAAFGRRADPAATAAVSAAAKHADAEVRGAAVSALGFLPGSAATAGLLAGVAAGDDSEAAKLARQSLTRLNGPGVAAAILAGAERGEPALRAVYLEALALRAMSDGLPLLLAARKDAAAPVRLAAAAALGDLGTTAQLGALLDWTLGATDEAEQTRALRSVVNVILRQPAGAGRGAALFAAIDQSAPAVAIRLLPALGRLGDAEAAACAARQALRGDAKLADAAVAALGRWPDASAVPALVDIAEKSSLTGPAKAARDAVLRHHGRIRDVWTEASSVLVGRLLAKETDAAGRAPLLALLHRARDAAALKLAESLGAEGALAAEVIRANGKGEPGVRVSGGSGARNVLDFKSSTRWTVPAAGEEWIELDFKVGRPLRTLILDQSTRTGEFPEKYEVYVSDRPEAVGTPVASGTGQRNQTVISLPAGTRGRYVTIKNVAPRADSSWTVTDLYVD